MAVISVSCEKGFHEERDSFVGIKKLKKLFLLMYHSFRMGREQIDFGQLAIDHLSSVIGHRSENSIRKHY
jgi:hypothetical protein